MQLTIWLEGINLAPEALIKVKEYSISIMQVGQNGFRIMVQ
jgi:hypothetical protein